MTLVPTPIDIADAAIDAHACDLGPEACTECDRLWSARADAHDLPTPCALCDAVGIVHGTGARVTA